MCLPVNGTYLVEVKRLDGYIDRVHCTRFADSAMLCYCVVTLRVVVQVRLLLWYILVIKYTMYLLGITR